MFIINNQIKKNYIDIHTLSVTQLPKNKKVLKNKDFQIVTVENRTVTFLKRKDSKIMKAKDYLSQVSVLNVKINQKRMQYEESLQTATSTGAVRYDKEKVQTSLTGDSTSNLICKYVDLQDEINRDIDRFVDLKNKIINEIHALSDVKFIRLLYMRYIEEKRLEQIAVELNYSYQYVRELHGYALKAFTDAHPELFESL